VAGRFIRTRPGRGHAGPAQTGHEARPRYARPLDAGRGGAAL